MKRAVLLLPIILVLTVGSVLAASRNSGGDAPIEANANVLESNGGNPVMDVLYAPSESDDPTFRTAIGAATGGATVDYFDARVGTPSLAILSNYDCVFTWANSPYQSDDGFGDNLADYVDAGGTVVLGAFVTYQSGNHLEGRIMTEGYSPVDSPSGNNHFSDSSYSGNGTTELYTNVNSLTCFYRDFLAIQDGGAIDGNYNDGEITAAFQPGVGVVYLNGVGGQPVACSGDAAQLVANACQFARVLVAPVSIGAPVLSMPAVFAVVLMLGGIGAWYSARRFGAERH